MKYKTKNLRTISLPQHAAHPFNPAFHRVVGLALVAQVREVGQVDGADHIIIRSVRGDDGVNDLAVRVVLLFSVGIHRLKSVPLRKVLVDVLSVLRLQRAAEQRCHAHLPETRHGEGGPTRARRRGGVLAARCPDRPAHSASPLAEGMA